MTTARTTIKQDCTLIIDGTPLAATLVEVELHGGRRFGASLRIRWEPGVLPGGAVNECWFLVDVALPGAEPVSARFQARDYELSLLGGQDDSYGEVGMILNPQQPFKEAARTLAFLDVLERVGIRQEPGTVAVRTLP